MLAKGITMTAVFEASALNRDEKIGGNILSIKKYSTSQGVYSFIGRAAIRHYLFSSLRQMYDWAEAPVKLAADKVIQFYFPAANIVSYPEMDLFGYMNTEQTKSSIIRKAPVGITKAVSLEPWMSDMAFYANHDMVRRVREQGDEGQPNLYQREEHYSLYKVSFTIDLSRLGYQELFFPEIPDNLKAYLDNLEVVDEAKIDLGARKQQVGEVDQWFAIVIEEKVSGYVGVKKENKNTRVVFAVAQPEYQQRLLQLLTVLKNGLVYHASTENYGIVPLFLIMGRLRLPVPLFHGAVRLKNRLVDADYLKSAFENDYIIQAYTGGPMAKELTLDDDKLARDWTNFMSGLGLSELGV